MANSSGRGYPLSPHVHTHRTLVETDDLTKENQVTYCREASLQGSLRFFILEQGCYFCSRLCLLFFFLAKYNLMINFSGFMFYQIH